MYLTGDKLEHLKSVEANGQILMLLSSAVKIVQGGDNIRNAQKEVLDTNFEPKIGFIATYLAPGKYWHISRKVPNTVTGY